MRSLIAVAVFALLSTPAFAQVADTPAAAPVGAQLTFASAALDLAPADASRPWMPPRAPQGMGMTGGRVVAIVIGAVVGGAIVYGAVRSMDCSDCKGDAATYGAIGGAVVGGFIGSVAYSFRQRRAVTPPASIR